MLRLGTLYEYARETGTLRELLAVCQQHESEQKKRWPASEGRDWHCARHGFTEKDAERAIGKQWAGLRTLAEGLVKNIPFGELSFEQRQKAALNVQFNRPSSYLYVESVEPHYEAQGFLAVGHETLHGWWWTENEGNRRLRQKADASDRAHWKRRTTALKKAEGVEILLLRLNWNDPPTELLKAFERFVAEYDPKIRNSSALGTIESLLDDLSALRLTKICGSREEAFDRLRECRLVKQSATGDYNPGNWSLMVNRARRRFSKLFKFEKAGPANDSRTRKLPQSRLYALSGRTGRRGIKNKFGESVDVLDHGTSPT